VRPENDRGTARCFLPDLKDGAPAADTRWTSGKIRNQPIRSGPNGVTVEIGHQTFAAALAQARTWLQATSKVC